MSRFLCRGVGVVVLLTIGFTLACSARSGGGGGGGGGNPADEGGASNGQDNDADSGSVDVSGPSTGPLGPELTAEARTAVITQVESMLPALSPEDVEGTRNAVVDALKDMPDVADAGANPDGSVWAVFSDGRPLLIALNNPIEAGEAESPSEAGDRPVRVKQTPAAPPRPAKQGIRLQDTGEDNSALFSFPASNRIFVFNGYGEEAYFESRSNQIAGWLVQRGYVDATPAGRKATIENLQQVQEVGVFYYFGHGGTIYIPLNFDDAPGVPTYEPVFGLGTLTERARDGSTDETYREMLDRLDIGYLLVPSILGGEERIFGAQTYSRYLITKGFVLGNWEFWGGSWVYIDACSSFDTVFKDACKEVGAGLYLGWTQTVVGAYAMETAEYLFSRVLGINEFAQDASILQETPPQRAFSFFETHNHMELTERRSNFDAGGASGTFLQSPSEFNSSASPMAELKYELAVDSATPHLQPGIRSLSIDNYESRLTLLGSFGSDEDSVVVGGEFATIEEWRPSQIICRISPSAAGPVVVEVDGHASDPRQLTLWSGPIITKYTSPSGVKSEFDLHVEFRGDVQSTRIFPGDPPVYESVPDFTLIPESSRVNSAEETGLLDCGPSYPGVVRISTPSLGTLQYLQHGLGDDEDGYYFAPDRTQGIPLNAQTGEMEVNLGYGIYVKDGVKQVSECENLEGESTYHLNLFGGLTDMITTADYDITHVGSVTEGGAILETMAELEAAYVPSNDDPR